MTIEPLHTDCLVCRSVTEGLTPPQTAVCILSVLASGIPADQAHRDLCFAHRREVEDVARAVVAERDAS